MVILKGDKAQEDDFEVNEIALNHMVRSYHEFSMTPCNLRIALDRLDAMHYGHCSGGDKNWSRNEAAKLSSVLQLVMRGVRRPSTPRSVALLRLKMVYDEVVAEGEGGGEGPDTGEGDGEEGAGQGEADGEAVMILSSQEEPEKSEGDGEEGPGEGEGDGEGLGEGEGDREAEMISSSQEGPGEGRDREDEIAPRSCPLDSLPEWSDEGWPEEDQDEFCDLEAKVANMPGVKYLEHMELRRQLHGKRRKKAAAEFTAKAAAKTKAKAAAKTKVKAAAKTKAKAAAKTKAKVVANSDLQPPAAAEPPAAKKAAAEPPATKMAVAELPIAKKAAAKPPAAKAKAKVAPAAITAAANESKAAPAAAAAAAAAAAVKASPTAAARKFPEADHETPRKKKAKVMDMDKSTEKEAVPRLTIATKSERGRDFVQVLLRPVGSKNTVSMLCLSPAATGLGMNTLRDVAERLVDIITSRVVKELQATDAAAIKQHICNESERILCDYACIAA